MDLSVCMILIGSTFEVSGSLNFILHNDSSVRKADGIIELRVCICLISREFAISSSFSFSFIFYNASPILRTERIIELR
jgi:hypothetical protein